jgi:hypothetical protein
VVQCGIWDGFGFMYATGDDPRTADGMGVGVFCSPDAPRPPQEEIDRELAAAREYIASRRVECPDAEPLWKRPAAIIDDRALRWVMARPIGAGLRRWLPPVRLSRR